MMELLNTPITWGEIILLSLIATWFAAGFQATIIYDKQAAKGWPGLEFSPAQRNQMPNGSIKTTLIACGFRGLWVAKKWQKAERCSS